MIQALRIYQQEYTFENKKGDVENISNLSKINIFVGANNSGKSRFMRSLILNKLNYIPYNLDLVKCNRFIFEICSPWKDYLSTINLRNNGNRTIIKNLEKWKEMGFLSVDSPYYDDIKQIGNIIQAEKKVIGGNQDYERYIKAMEKSFNEHKENLGEDQIALLQKVDHKIVYIPILRGLRPISEIGQNNSFSDPYEARTQHDYFKRDTTTKDSAKLNEYKVFTGLKLYETVRKMLLGDPEERDLINAFQIFLSNNFFNEQRVTLIPKLKDSNDVLHIKIGDQEERPIYDLGDGLQTIIIATFPLFENKNQNLLLFIEEPELTLHPGMQRKLLSSFCNPEFEKLQVFLTTHSNHFLDLTMDYNDKTSIYSFEKESDEKFIVKNVTPNKDILNLLDVRNSSVFLSNCVIWVEGISDRLYIQKFLELYLKESQPNNIYEEDTHYSIIEYGGDNITHFNFDEINNDNCAINVDAISKNNFLVCDNDGNTDFNEEIADTDNDKLRRLKNLKELLRENFFASHREIENLIPYKVYEHYFKNLKPHENRSWKVKENFKSEEDFKKVIDKEKIGLVLKECFIETKGEESKSFKKDDILCISSTKVEIAKKLNQSIIEVGIEFRELSETAKTLTKKIYNFIKENNQ